ncbi:flagellar hook-length control protein FliK [Pseudarthrobacter sp. NPDC058362]|uniref:flagellar hook-length control protein FliK n=1 Tax=unclassified Pseudarthrobacter TaxID=2647000 RepID=UPI003669DC19
MITIDQSRLGTSAPLPRKDKSAGMGDAGFGVQMRKALAAGPSERRGDGDRSAASAPEPADRGAIERARQRAVEDARTTARNDARNSGMEGAGPEPGASAPSVQRSGRAGSAANEAVPADAATVAAQAGMVSGAGPAAGESLAGPSAAGPLAAQTAAEAVPFPLPGGQSAGTAAQGSEAALSTTAARQLLQHGATDAAVSATAAAPGLPAAFAVSGGTTGSTGTPGTTSATALSTASATPVTQQTAAPLVGNAQGAAGNLGGTAADGGTAAGAAEGSLAPAVSLDPAGTLASAATPAASGGNMLPAAGDLQEPAQPAVVGPVSGTLGQGTPAQALSQAPAPAAGQVPASAHAPLAGQLAGPVFSLATAKPGQHTMTLSVTPENLGPVTVRAHIGAEGVRVELFAPNDAGRDALRSILQDLKRDLASAGLGSNLDLSARSGPDDHAHEGAQDGTGGRPAERAGNSPRQFQAVSSPALPGQEIHPHLRYAGTTGLDVLA